RFAPNCRGTPFAVAALRTVRENISSVPFSMTDSSPLEPQGNTSAGHLTVHLAAGPAEVPFLFEQQQKRIAPAFAASLGSHIAIVIVGLLLARYASQIDQTVPFLPQVNPNAIIWLS